MDLTFRNNFLQKWARYFGDSELPITFFYVDDPGDIARANIPDKHNCIVCELALVRKGCSLAWNGKSLGCGGAKRYLGYTSEMRPDFEYFLSHGIPGKVEGRIEGRVEGRVEGESKLLKRQLERRFGALPAWAIELLSNANEPSLEAWGVAILTAQTLEAVFNSEASH